jgi:hypothetical protein
MAPHDLSVPENLPVLSRGKHRSPRKGACFMEFASYLAGERWSDHPACTHPLLAAVARHVNDYTSDHARSRLAPLIPSVIGLTSDDPHVDAHIALRCAVTALPVVAAERQRVMAVAVLACERMLDELDGRPPGTLGEASRSALKHVPHAARWAFQFSQEMHPSSAGFRRRAAPHIVAKAAEGIARACVPDPDPLLRDLLIAAITECRAYVGRFDAGERGGESLDAERIGSVEVATQMKRAGKFHADEPVRPRDDRPRRLERLFPA